MTLYGQPDLVDLDRHLEEEVLVQGCIANEQLRARLNELLVEYVEGAAVVGITDARAEQRVAVPQHALEVAARRVVPGRERAEEIVEEVATL